MARVALFLPVVAAAMLTAASAHLHACSCAPYRAKCVPEWTADAVFVGKVTAISHLAEPKTFGSRRVTLAVEERFKGVDGRLIDVLTGSGGGDCGFNFTLGSTYLVFAHRLPTTGRLGTGICSRTSLANRANQELKRLRMPVPQWEQPALVHGRAMRTDPQSVRTPRVNEPFAGARVRVVGERGSWESVTGADGRYEFHVPVGRYRMTVEVGDRFYSDPDATDGLDVRVVDLKPCAPIDIGVRSNGLIRGRMVDSRERGVPFLSLELADRSGRNLAVMFPDAKTITDADGNFLFDRIAPGQYHIGLTLRRYSRRPDSTYADLLQSAVPLDIGFGTNLDAGDIRIPDGVDVQQVRGVVVDEAGAPAPKVEVWVSTPKKEMGVSSEPVLTDAQGRFLISVIAGRKLELVAEDRSATGDRLTYRTARSSTFDAAVIQSPFTLIVK